MKSQAPQTCSFCGSKSHSNPFAGGEWHAHIGTICCCHTCATTVLPALIADSVHINGNYYYYYALGQQRLQAVELAFWKALTARVSREAAE